MTKFKKEFENNSKTKNIKLKNAIQEALEIFKQQKPAEPQIEIKSQKSIYIFKKEMKSLIKRPKIRLSTVRKPSQETIELDGIGNLIPRIVNYLKYLAKFDDVIEFERDCLIKVLEYLRKYKIDNPKEFLKVFVFFN
jgi:hypothetical protein